MKRESHEDKRKRIIESTIKLIQSVGFERVSIRSICDTAHISIGTFYHYFRDKDDLLNDMMHEIDDFYITEIIPQLNFSTASENLKHFTVSFAFHTINRNSSYGSILSHTSVPLPSTVDGRML